MKVLVFGIVLLILLHFSVKGVTKHHLPQLDKPENIVISNGQILITQFPKVFVYSQKDFKYLFDFGKKGEGPQEFAQYIRIQKKKGKIVVGSHMKLSYYTLDGKFIKEVRSKYGGGIFRVQTLW